MTNDVEYFLLFILWNGHSNQTHVTVLPYYTAGNILNKLWVQCLNQLYRECVCDKQTNQSTALSPLSATSPRARYTRQWATIPIIQNPQELFKFSSPKWFDLFCLAFPTETLTKDLASAFPRAPAFLPDTLGFCMWSRMAIHASCSGNHKCNKHFFLSLSWFPTLKGEHTSVPSHPSICYHSIYFL